MADRSSLVNPRSRSAVDNDHPVRLPPTATSSASESANLAAAPSTTRVTAPASRPSYSTRYLPANPTHKPSFPPNLPTPSTLQPRRTPPSTLHPPFASFPVTFASSTFCLANLDSDTGKPWPGLGPNGIRGAQKETCETQRKQPKNKIGQGPPIRKRVLLSDSLADLRRLQGTWKSCPR